MSVDVDVFFLRGLDDVFQRAVSNYSTRKYFGTSSFNSLVTEVSLISAGYLGHHKSEMRSKSSLSRYSWFFDIPVYESADFLEFVKYITAIHGGLDAAISNLTYFSFDHFIFIKWLVDCGKAELIDVTDLVGYGKVTDGLALEDIYRVKAVHDYMPLWARFGAALSKNITGQFLALYYLDRPGIYDMSVRQGCSVELFSGGRQRGAIMEGFYPPEAEGRWVRGERASIQIIPDFTCHGCVLVTEISWALDMYGEPPIIQFEVNGEVHDPMSISLGQHNGLPRLFYWPMPEAIIRAGCVLSVVILALNPRNPKKIGVSSDDRDLSVMIRSVFFDKASTVAELASHYI